MGRPLVLLGLLAQQSLGKMLAYRLSALFTVVFGVLFAVAEVIAIIVYYQYTDEIAGWDLPSFLALNATYGFIQYLYQFLFVIAHEELMDRIIGGELDYDLVRPVDSQLLCSIRTLDYPSLINLLIPTALLVYCARTLGLGLSLPVVICYMVLIVLGVALYYLLNQFFVAMAFWVERPRRLAGVAEYLFEFASRPRSVYPRALQVLFTAVLPILTAVNAPAELIRGELEPGVVILFAASLAILGVIVRIQWLCGVRRYASAS